MSEIVEFPAPRFTSDERIEKIINRCAETAGWERAHEFADYLLAELWEGGFTVVPFDHDNPPVV
jgi:hypothetical protein